MAPSTPLLMKTTYTKAAQRKTSSTADIAVDPYQVLQVRRDATRAEIRHAYRRLALLHHPGRSSVRSTSSVVSEDTTTELSRRMHLFQELAACYETLVDKEARRRCDFLLKEIEVQQQLQRNKNSKKSIAVQSRQNSIIQEKQGSVIGKSVWEDVDHLHTTNLSPKFTTSSLGSGGCGQSIPLLMEASSDDESSYSSADEGYSPDVSLEASSSDGDDDDGDVNFVSPLSSSCTSAEEEHVKKQQQESASTRGEQQESASTRGEQQAAALVAAEQEEQLERMSSGIGILRVPTEELQLGSLCSKTSSSFSSAGARRENGLRPLRILDCSQASTDGEDEDANDEGERGGMDPVHKSIQISFSGDDEDEDTSRASDHKSSFLMLPSPTTTDALTSVWKAVSPAADTGDIHYTRAETQRLFGGPLHVLYRARRWKPFRDPNEVFAEVFGSKVQLGRSPLSDFYDDDNIKANLSIPDLASIPSQPLSHSLLHTLPPKHYPNGSTLYRSTRTVQNRQLVRTELVWTDPCTGEKHSKVTVTAYDLSSPAETNDTQMPKSIPMCISWEIMDTWCSCPFASSTSSTSKNDTTILPGKSQRDESWNLSTACQYWLPGCL